MRFEASLDLKPVDIAIQLSQEVDRDTEVDDGGWRTLRAPGFCLRGVVCPGGLRTPLLGLPGVSRGCRHSGGFGIGLSSIAKSIMLH